MKLTLLLVLLVLCASCRTGYREIDLHRRPSSAYYAFPTWGSSAHIQGGLQTWSDILREQRVALTPPCKSGVVVVSFKVTKTGVLDSTRVSKGLCELADQNALMMVQNSGRWIPAEKDRMTIDSWVSLRIPFQHEIRN